ncbi:hypothetical protein Droror1_Dr00026729 [Drosera rotundifolia]
MELNRQLTEEFKHERSSSKELTSVPKCMNYQRFPFHKSKPRTITMPRTNSTLEAVPEQAQPLKPNFLLRQSEPLPSFFDSQLPRTHSSQTLPLNFSQFFFETYFYSFGGVDEEIVDFDGIEAHELIVKVRCPTTIIVVHNESGKGKILAWGKSGSFPDGPCDVWLAGARGESMGWALGCFWAAEGRKEKAWA